MLEDYWFRYFSSNQPSAYMNQDSSSNPSSLSLERFGGLFLITGISSTLVLSIFFLCFVYRKRHALRGFVTEKLEFLKGYIHYYLPTLLRNHWEKNKTHESVATYISFLNWYWIVIIYTAIILAYTNPVWWFRWNSFFIVKTTKKCNRLYY